MSAPDLVPPGTTGGGAPVGGSGTIGTIPKWATTTTLGDSVITESSAGNVGIGITPIAGHRASVSGRIGGGIFGDSYIEFQSTGATALRANNIVNIGYSNTVNVTNAGLVGIGTTVPQTTLDSSGIVTSRTGASSAPLSPTEGIRFSLSAQPDAYVTTIYRNSIFNSVSSIPTDSSMQFRLGNGASSQATIMTLKGDGNVGIGTASPTAALHLPTSTTARASLNITSGTAPTSPNNGDIWFDGTDIKMQIGGVTKTFTLV